MSTPSAATAVNRPQNAVYKLVVRSAEEAVEAIRSQLGEHAKVLSVRQVPGQGLSGLFGRPRLEVIAQVDSGEAEAPVATPPSAVDTQPAAGAAVTPTVTDRTFAAQATLARAAANPAPTSRPGMAEVKLPDLLRRSGFSETLLSRLQTSLPHSSEAPLHRALADFGQALRSSSATRPARSLPSRVAFLGTAGSGRTTVLSKWLAHCVFVQNRTCRVIKAEFDRPNPAEGLAVFCEALGIPLDHFASSAPGTRMIPDDAPEHIVLVDLPSLSLRSADANKATSDFLTTEKIDGRVLVLNALHDLPSLRAGYTAGREMGATHLVFTHVDELGHWGKLLDFLIDGELTPLFLATGPSLTGDFEEDALGAVLRKTLPGS